jgi:nuclease-like protein
MPVPADASPVMPDELEKYYVKARPALVTRRAGQSAQQKAEELRTQAPIRTVLERLQGIHTAERAWRKGAEGEQRVGDMLAKLPRDEWHVFNDVPIGAHNANIDHLVIGPAGVFTLNTKNLTGNVWIAERALLHNGKKTPYLPKAVREADRARILLSKASGLRVSVNPVLVVFADRINVKAAPKDVSVLSSHRLKEWFLTWERVLSHAEAMSIACAADNPATWQNT